LIKLREEPIEGKANEALKELVAREILQIGKDQVEIIRGGKNRDKIVKVEGIEYGVAWGRIREKSQK